MARGHDLPDGDFIQLEGSVDQGLLKLGQQAHAAGGGGDELELLRGVDGGAIGHGDIESEEDDGGRSLEEAHSGAGKGDEKEHGRSDGNRESFSPAQGKRFGHQLANHHMEVSDEAKSKGDSDDVGVDESVRLGEGQQAQPAHQNGGGERLAQPAESQ